MDKNYEFLLSMPKAELHAHLNGSLSRKTMEKLMKLKNICVSEEARKIHSFFETLSEQSLPCCFQIFQVIHQLTDSTEAIYIATVDVIKEFAEDNVYYLELRTTPRIVKGSKSIQAYTDAVLKAIDDCRRDGIPILVKLLLSIDRSQGYEIASEMVDLIIDLGHQRSDVVLGLDVSGNMIDSNIEEYFPLLEKVRRSGLKLTVHAAEIRNDSEAEAILRLKPNRVGHGTFFSPSLIGHRRLLELLKNSRIPVEICLTSNVICKTVTSYSTHHMKIFLDENIPFSICTDDKGVFGTCLSQEYFIALNSFNLSVNEMWELSLRSIDYSFASPDEKNNLKLKWNEWYRKRNISETQG